MPSVDEWFGPRGLYNNREDTRPFQTSFEYIPPPHANAEAGPQLRVDCGVGSQGGSSSQRNWKDPKSSLRLRFKAEFGVPKLRAGPTMGTSALRNAQHEQTQENQAAHFNGDLAEKTNSR